jgi:hypothetical protein
MRTLARAATSSLAVLGGALALVVAVVAVIGILATRSATAQGNVIAGDELTTAIVTGQLARSMDAAYAAGQQAVLATAPAERSRLLGSLYATLLPAVDARLFTLEQLHAADPPAEHADMELFGRQWAAVRKLLSPADLPATPATPATSATAGAALTAAYAPVSIHLGRLFARERDDARADHADADASAVRAVAWSPGPPRSAWRSARCCSRTGAAASAGTWSRARTRPNSPTPCRSPATRTRRSGCSSGTWSARSRRPAPWCSTGTTAPTGSRR